MAPITGAAMKFHGNDRRQQHRPPRFPIAIALVEAAWWIDAAERHPEASLVECVAAAQAALRRATRRITIAESAPR